MRFWLSRIWNPQHGAECRYQLKIHAATPTAIYISQLPGRLFSPSDNSKKKLSTNFYCIFQLVWVPMTITQNIRVFFWGFYKTLFYKGPPLNSFKIFFMQRGNPYEKSVLSKVLKHTLIFWVVVMETNINSKMQ